MNESKYDIYLCGGHWLKIHVSIGVCHKYEMTTIQKTQSTHHYDGTSRIAIVGRFEYKIYKICGNIQEFSSVGQLTLSQNLSSGNVFFSKS
jgi:hypothetical protein